ncbi:hypothetical protein L1887_21320 [Cichorium endivia]|nr:hypothetical protein L1887_21320 [Cichorium endivia]
MQGDFDDTQGDFDDTQAEINVTLLTEKHYIQDDNRKRFCRHCNKEYARSTNTKYLISHLVKKHKDELNSEHAATAETNLFVIESATTFHKNTSNALRATKGEILKTVQDTTHKVSLSVYFWETSEELCYISISLHFIDKSWKLKNVVLEIKALPFASNEEEIYDCILKFGGQRRSDTVLVSTINDADQGSADVAFRTPLAPYEKSNFLGFGGSMVARLKLKGIDGRAPPGVEPAA